MIKTFIVSALTAGLVLSSAHATHANVVTTWNAITLGCATPPNRSGPPGLLDIALVQAAVHDAVQAIEGRYEPYHYRNASMRGAGSVDAAAAAAAHGVLSGLWGASATCLQNAPNPAVTYAGDPGLQAGIEAAAALLPLARPTFTSSLDPFTGGTAPGEWRLTPGVTQAANTFMAYTPPFALLSARQFRPEGPPPLSSEKYYREYEEVRQLGALNNSTRTPEQTDLARFWLGNPIPTWYATVRSIADQHAPGVGDSARLLALVAIAAADSQIAVYDSKHHYNFWRPITAIHEGDNDGNARTVGNGAWAPFMATPPYADYSSGANCLSGSLLTTLELFFGSDDFEFSITSPTGGLTTNPRRYRRFSDAAQDVVEVRILQGIHFRSADEDARRQGGRIAHWVFQKFLRPVAGR